MARRSYDAAAHAMQTGVAYLMQHEPDETSPKHLRVAVNAAMVDSAALAGLLIKKGIITEEEYLSALTDGMNAEADRYQKRLNDRLGGGGKINLH